MTQYHLHENRGIVAADGTMLNIGIWRAVAPVASLFYIHGLQSHGGWLFETGPYLASHGINVIAMDRRGSGRSGGMRGHSPSGNCILDDYQLALDFARRVLGDLPLLAMGQSFGGSILAALACRHPLQNMPLIFSAPALGQQRVRLDPHEVNRRRAKKGPDVFPIELRDLDYSQDDKYLRFIANDARIVRVITESMRSAMIELEDIYHDNQSCLQALRAPMYFIEPQRDSIVDIKTSRQILSQYVKVEPYIIDTHSHYIEFTNKRYELWDKLRQLCTSGQEQHA